jgi:molecular chaperone Hsp33
MADGVARALLNGNLTVSVALITDTAREARRRHALAPVSASLVAQGLAGGVLLASLQKNDSRINLQLECDGPFGGFFVDASSTGTVRAYAKNTLVDLELGEGPFRWRGALGNKGFLSVLRDIGPEFYRSSVELLAMNVAEDLTRYFAISDQVPTCVAIELHRLGDEGLGSVAGVVVQALPDAVPGALDQVAKTLAASLTQAIAAEQPNASALLTALFPTATPLVEVPVVFACTCSKARVLRTLASLGATEIQDIVDTMGSTAVTCHFCGTRHEVTLIDLFALLEELGVPKNRN